MEVKVGLDKVRIQYIRFTMICEYTFSKKTDLPTIQRNVEDGGLVLIDTRKEVKTSRDDEEEMEVKV